jgi:hypothetical protein
MLRRPKNVTIVILSEDEAKELSVRRSLRSILRDCRFLVRALWSHWRGYGRTVARGCEFKNCWWTRREGHATTERSL